MRRRISLFLMAALAATALSLGGAAEPQADEAKHSSGRPLPKMPKFTKPILFNTPEADKILAALQVFPEDNPWNEDISKWPLHKDSKKMIESIGPNKILRCNMDMGFVLIPPGQKKVPVKVTNYAEESDKGPFPVPDNMPIEGWPLAYKDKTLEEVQSAGTGDRHGIVVDPINRMLYEFGEVRKMASGWEATQASIFDLKSNKLRPAGWTSADAAGLPIFPAVVRYDELQRGMVEHAMRVTVTNTRKAYTYPARHYASNKTATNLPRMGERIRLRKDYDISEFSPHVKAILKGLKKYGMFVADNGLDWSISVAPDERIEALAEEFRKIKGSAFEIVVKDE